MRVFVPTACFALCACATAAPREAMPPPQANSSAGERLLAGKVAGEPVGCIRARDADHPVQLANGATAYRVSSSLAYVQQFGGRCDLGRVASDAYLIRRATQTQLCRGDIAELVDRSSNFPIGSCVYGDFVPYRTPAR